MRNHDDNENSEHEERNKLPKKSGGDEAYLILGLVFIALGVTNPIYYTLGIVFVVLYLSTANWSAGDSQSNKFDPEK